jgi:hypothetical protein
MLLRALRRCDGVRRRLPRGDGADDRDDDDDFDDDFDDDASGGSFPRRKKAR